MDTNFEDLVNRFNAIKGEPRASVLLIHLFVEYFLNEILRKKLSNPKKILDKYTFAQKVDIIESLEVFPQELLYDIRKTNEIRNLFAHNIEIESNNFQEELFNKVKELSHYKQMNNADKMTSYQIFTTLSVGIHHRINAIIKDL